MIAGLDSGLPSPVFRAYSPDGLTEIRLLPGFNWVVMQKSGWEGLGVPPEHIYLNGTLTAAQFLDRYVHTLGVVHVVGPMSVGNTYQQQFDDLIRQMNTNNPKTAEFSVTTTGDATALRIETVNGTFTIEQRLRARVICSLWAQAVADQAGDCFARIDVLRAPKGQLDALVEFVDAHSLTNAKHDDAWLSRIIRRRNDNLYTSPAFEWPAPNQAALAMLRQQAADLGLDSKSGHENKDKAMITADTRTDSSITDWADFALDVAPHYYFAPTFAPEDVGKRLATMQIALRRSVIRAWSSTDGQQYTTANPGANPNSVLAGTWTQESTPQ